MFTKTVNRLKKFNEENPRFVGYCTGVVLMTVAFSAIDRIINNQNEAAGFKNIRLYKDSETGDILAEDLNGYMWKAEFPEDV